MYEIADGIVDISLLESGYARDVNGSCPAGPLGKAKGGGVLVVVLKV